LVSEDIVLIFNNSYFRKQIQSTRRLKISIVIENSKRKKMKSFKKNIIYILYVFLYTLSTIANAELLLYEKPLSNSIWDNFYGQYLFNTETNTIVAANTFFRGSGPGVINSQDIYFSNWINSARPFFGAGPRIENAQNIAFHETYTPGPGSNLSQISGYAELDLGISSVMVQTWDAFYWRTAQGGGASDFSVVSFNLIGPANSLPLLPAVPEPGTLNTLLFGLIILALVGRKKESFK